MRWVHLNLATGYARVTRRRPSPNGYVLVGQLVRIDPGAVIVDDGKADLPLAYPHEDLLRAKPAARAK
jgi:hypothetical protein